MNILSKFLAEGSRSFYVSGNRVHFTRGQEHVSVDITKFGPSDVATDVIAQIMVVNAMSDLQRELKREPSYEELADKADEEAHEFADQVRRKVLHMGASDFRRVAEELFPGLDKEAPKPVEESLSLVEGRFRDELLATFTDRGAPTVLKSVEARLGKTADEVSPQQLIDALHIEKNSGSWKNEMKAGGNIFDEMERQINQAAKRVRNLKEGFRVPDDELKMGRHVRWYDDEHDRLMFGQIVNVTAHNVTVNDGKFKTDQTYKVDPEKIVKVSEDGKRGGKPKVVWTRGL